MTNSYKVQKREGVITIGMAWKADADLPVQDYSLTPGYQVFAALTGEMEAGPVADNAVNAIFLGEVSTIDDIKHEVTIVTPYHVMEQLPSAGVITAGDLGLFVLEGNAVLPYDSQTHSVGSIVGVVMSTSAKKGDPVWVLRK